MTESARGRLIVVSGVDGSGKTTLLADLARVLRARGHRVTSVAALKPGTPVPLGWLREISPAPLLRQQAELWTAGYFALVFQHNQDRVIAPALNRGDWVLADRWGLDHLANQTALGVDPGPWRPAIDHAIKPDVHYLIDVPAELAAERIARRGGDPGIGSGEDFLRRCTGLMRSAAVDPAFSPVRILDGTQSKARLLAAALTDLVLATTAPKGRPS